MDELLNKYSDCDSFSLTHSLYRNKIIITEEEFNGAINKILEKDKKELKNKYKRYQDWLIDSPSFNKIYSDIVNECYEYSKHSKCASFIVDEVGRNTKYGEQYQNYFYQFYMNVGMTIDRENDKEIYFDKRKYQPSDILSKELRNKLLYYEFLFYNNVTVIIE